MKLRCDKCGRKFEAEVAKPKGQNLCDKCVPKGKAGRVYRLTEKAEKLLPIAEKFLRDLKEAEKL